MIPEEVKDMIEDATLENEYQVITIEKKDFHDFVALTERYLTTTNLKKICRHYGFV